MKDRKTSELGGKVSDESFSDYRRHWLRKLVSEGFPHMHGFSAVQKGEFSATSSPITKSNKT